MKIDVQDVLAFVDQIINRYKEMGFDDCFGEYNEDCYFCREEGPK